MHYFWQKILMETMLYSLCWNSKFHKSRQIFLHSLKEVTLLSPVINMAAM
uniref:Uncharacterized protein n=1 Tax=Rhizophora mucronata TaxID=61149 RepID=A0A2P2R3H3_RHIMU